MKKNGKQRVREFALAAMVVTVLLGTQSCNKESEEDRPELPPVESLLMDFSDFSSSAGGAKASIESYVNFNHAFTSLTFWSSATTLTMALPVAAYGHALQQSPEYLGNNTWEWSYEFTWNSVSYKATLTGTRISNEEFTMEMVIGLAALPGEGVLWFDGTVRYDHTHASWTIYSEGTVAVLEIEWAMDYELGDGSLQYTYVKPDEEQTGSYLIYEYAPEELYDASFTVSLAAGTTLVQWDTASKAGQVQDEVKFGDSSWHCWDSLANNLADISCE